MTKMVECWSCEFHMTLEQRSANDGYCPQCRAEIDLEDGGIYEVKTETLSETPMEVNGFLPERLRATADTTDARSARLLMYQAADKIEQLRALVELARNTYIQDYSDGETDCVTPYDVYD